MKEQEQKGKSKKRLMTPGTMLNPIPAVLVTSSFGGEKDVMTVAWTGIINSKPPMTYVSVRKDRYSHRLIQEGGNFAINLVSEDLIRACDYCGVKSARETDKFADCGFTLIRADEIEAPLIGEAPINLECRVIEVHEYPSHDMFVGEIVAVHADEDLFDEDGQLSIERADLVAYCHGAYYGIRKKKLGSFGYSVMKAKTRKRRIKEENQKKRSTKEGNQKKRIAKEEKTKKGK